MYTIARYIKLCVNFSFQFERILQIDEHHLLSPLKKITSAESQVHNLMEIDFLCMENPFISQVHRAELKMKTIQLDSTYLPLSASRALNSNEITSVGIQQKQQLQRPYFPFIE